jgi:outer membrane protein OmpA-like peptidoglycan-associated protein
VDFAWKGYLALDAVSILRRFEQRFGTPGDGRIVLDRGRLELSGAMPYEWLDRVRREAVQVPGVTGLAENDVAVRYDPTLVLQRFQSTYPLPAGAVATVTDGTLNLTGQVPYEWIAPIRKEATKLPGVLAVSEAGLKVAFDPKLVLDRFTNTFTLPDTVTAVLREGGILALSGEASHRWLTRVTEGAKTIPGVTSLDAKQVVDVDRQTYQQSKSVIESAFVYFLPNKDNFATEGFAALSRLPDEIRRCETAAKRIGLTIQLEIRGSADGVGLEAKNLDLSQRRAAAVRDFLISCGLDAGMLQTVGLGAGSSVDRTTPEQADRRVAFRVLTYP